MRTNSIGKIRKDLDNITTKHAKLERKLNIVIGAVIISGILIMTKLFL